MKKIIILIILSTILQIGCGDNSKQEMVEKEEAENISMGVSSEDKTIIDRSEDLADYVVELFGIDDAATVILNDTALVGVVMAYDSELTEDMRNLINDLVLEKDKSIKQVSISEDEKIFNEVVDIINNLMNGAPYDKYVNAISQMIEKTNKKQ